MNVTEISAFKNKCTGCLACVQACPVQSLRCEKDDEGFYYPVIDSEKCINCEKCIKVCAIEKNAPPKKEKAIFACYCNDEQKRMQGSSGGVMVAFSELFVKQGDVVYGAVFDSKTKSVYHTSSDCFSIEDLSRSKYVQSYIGNSFCSVKKQLESNRNVLFCGTPCQVQGLKNFLGKDYSGLYTVDFFCHGVPSPVLFEDMLKMYENEDDGEVTYISFREKTMGWRKQSTRIITSKGKEHVFKSIDEPYYFYFLNNYSLRRSCYSCSAYCSHFSDITVSDYWNIKKEYDDDKGASLLVINTEKGNELLSSIKAEVCEISCESQLNYSLYEHRYSTKKREVFFKEYGKKGFEFVWGEFFKKEKAKQKLLIKTKKSLLRALGKKV